MELCCPKLKKLLHFFLKKISYILRGTCQARKVKISDNSYNFLYFSKKSFSPHFRITAD